MIMNQINLFPKDKNISIKKILFSNQGFNNYPQSTELNILPPIQNYFLFDSKIRQVRTRD